MKNRDVSPERKFTYYLGMLMTAIGGIAVISFFFSMFNDMGERVEPSDLRGSFIWFFIGGLLMVAGQFIMRIGHSGLAGSGVILDAEEARRDLEPWSRMGGGRLSDALDEAGIDLSPGSVGGDGEMPFDEKLRRLEGLRKAGLVSEEEFPELRKRILSEIDEE